MKQIFRNISILLIASVGVISCTERIDIRLDNTYTRLVVEGYVTTDTMAHKVKLSLTSDYFFNKPPVMVTNAVVTISYGPYIEVLTESEAGIYKTDSSFYGVPGITYTLSITLNESVNGFTQYSAISTLKPVADIDSLGLAWYPDWGPEGIWEVRAYLQDPPEENYYRILLSRNSTLLTDTLYEWYITDDTFFNGNYVNGAGVGYLVQDYHDQNVSPGDTITVEFNGIEGSFADFIMEAQTEIWGSNPLFSGPSANIKGNISNGAIGYFAAISAKRASITVPFR
jgi:hypothetical protein